MTLLTTIGIYLFVILSGGMFVHLIWPEREIKILFFKFFLGIGVGLGFSSLFYFLYLFTFAGQRWFVFIQLAIFLVLLAFTIWKEKNLITLKPPSSAAGTPPKALSRTQIVLVGIAAVVFIVSLLGTGSYLLRRQQGDWDAWMMYNRAARFIYRDQIHWLESFSRQMDPIFHADYPLLLALNVTSGWETLGTESAYVQMIQSALFALAALGIFVSALASLKSIGQAALGLIIFWGTPTLVNEGAREMADLPVAFFILATVILIYFYFVYKKPTLIALAGLTAGLAAWTKNEGTLFVVGVVVALVVAFMFGSEFINPLKPPSSAAGTPPRANENLVSSRLSAVFSQCRDFVVNFKNNFLPALLRFSLGLVFPFAITIFFKLFLAPPSDVLRGTATAAQKILAISRHLEILQFTGREFLNFGGWTNLIGIIPALIIYFLLFRLPAAKELRPAYLVGITILAVQLLGDYGVYLITPYDLTWHLSYSIERIVLQIFPVIAFLILCASRTPENIFDESPKSSRSIPLRSDFDSNQPRRQETSDSRI